MKKMLIAALAAASLLAMAACSDKTTVEVQNGNTVKTNVSLKVGDGNTININNVEGGTTSEATEIGQGECRVTTAMESGNSPADTTFTAEKSKGYTVIISSGSNPTVSIEE